jgi:glycosyltransferase involved in cell wall biosynthesis
MYLRQQWKKMTAFERAMCRRFDSVVTVSAEDREIIRRDYGATHVYDVPSGVDVGFFRPSGTVTSHPNSLVFTGSMDWLPNGDGIRYFTEQIFPLIKNRIPDVRLVIVGRNPNSHLLEVAKHDSSITVTGRVEDVRPYMERAAAFIVPLRIGSGTRLKIFEAMAMEKPIISTTIGAEGLPVVHNRDLLLADTPETFAQEVVRVLSDGDLARRLGQQAAEHVRREFDWRRAAEDFSNFCERAIELDHTGDLCASFEVGSGRRQRAN